MAEVLGLLAVWTIVALAVGVLVGRHIRFDAEGLCNSASCVSCRKRDRRQPPPIPEYVKIIPEERDPR